MTKRSQANTLKGLLKSKKSVSVDDLLKTQNDTVLLHDMIADLERGRNPAEGFVVIGMYSGYARIATTLSPDSTLACLVRAKKFCLDTEDSMFKREDDEMFDDFGDFED